MGFIGNHIIIVIYACSYYAHTNYRALAFDQDIFYVIGRNWAEGKLPYVTAWDSKGPYIFSSIC